MSSETTLKGKFQLPDPTTASLFRVTEQKAEENDETALKWKKKKKRNKHEDLLSHTTAFTSRHSASDCAKSRDVTRSGSALSLTARLICIHTWKSGLE